MSNPKFNVEALKSEIRNCVINQKANACPMIVRLAWHSSGTFNKEDGSGGSNGAGMRFEPESTDGANAGLSIARDMLLPVKQAHPDLSYSDLWTLAGAAAVEFVGGPKVPHHFGRGDKGGPASDVPNGRLPDASQGAQHLRDVFYRMGFDDRGIVSLSGAHTLGRCHLTRSGFDGPWTRHPLKFDNQYFKNLLDLKWTATKTVAGNLQYADESGELMMLPTDLALVQDDKFRPWVELYARDEPKFFSDFAQDFARLMSLGAPAVEPEGTDQVSALFREAAMHGSVAFVEKYSAKADVHQLEASSGRSALHKAAFWGHELTIKVLLGLKLNANVQDYNGDTAAHDAARFGHLSCVALLLDAGADTKLKNRAGQDVLAVAQAYEQAKVVDLLKTRAGKL
jgi:catalase (peroxidase I)